MSNSAIKKDERKENRSDKAARHAMWTHYKDNRNLYIEEIREFRDDILYELIREENVVAVFSKYKKTISKAA
jgi:hypothetical protein